MTTGSSLAVILGKIGIKPQQISLIERLGRSSDPTTNTRELREAEDEIWAAASEGRITADEIIPHQAALTRLLGDSQQFGNLTSVANGFSSWK